MIDHYDITITSYDKYGTELGSSVIRVAQQTDINALALDLTLTLHDMFRLHQRKVAEEDV